MKREGKAEHYSRVTTGHNSLGLGYAVLAGLLLLAGYLYYIQVRNHDPVFNVLQTLLPHFRWASPFAYNLPTFIHVLAMCLLSYAVTGVKRYNRGPVLLFWASLNLVLELLQYRYSGGLQILPGRFDLLDIAAIPVAGLVFMALTYRADTSRIKMGYFLLHHAIARSIGLACVGLFGMVSIIASYEYDTYEPVYMSYEELRGPLKTETDRALAESGKIYLYQSLLLVSEPNKGIHIYDNSNPQKPVHRVFINIPGNLDIAVRGDYLYADSFIDLLVIDINDLDNIRLSQRIEWAFPYNPYQAVPLEARYFFSWDKKKGVIIGIRELFRNADKLQDNLYDL